MADTKEVSPVRPKRRLWPRVLAWTFSVLVVLLIVAYFAATSTAFLKSVVLPRVSKSLNADVTVRDASIRPFRQVVLRDLKVQAKGEEPVITAPEARASYHLFDIIRGNLHVDEVVLASPTVLLVEHPDGTSNLDALLESQKDKPKKKKKERAKSETRIDVQKLALNNATVRRIKEHAGGRRDVTELASVNVTLDNLKNGQTGKLALSADLKVENNPPPPAAAGLLQGRLKGSFDFALTPDLKPGSIQGSARLQVSRAEGALKELADVGSDLKCDVTPSEIRQVALQFQKAGAALGELRASGPFDVEKTEGRIRVELLALDRRVLNLAGAKTGIDFGSTTINSTNEIQFTNSGSLITAAGRFDASKLQLTRTNQTTPTVDMRAEYNVTVDRAQSNALLRTFTVTGTQNSRPLLRGELTNPMTLAWGPAANAVGDSALNLAVTNLNLADWKPFLGNSAPGGKASLNAHLVSQQGGKQLAFELAAQIANLTARIGTNSIPPADLTLQARGQAADLKQFTLREYTLQLVQQNQPALVVSGSGTYDRASESADLQLNGRATLAKLFQLLARPDLTASAGTAELKARIVQKQNAQTITGNLALADFTGQSGRSQFRNFGVAMDLDVSKTPEQLQLRNVAGKLSEGENDGGRFTLTGTCSLANKAAQFTAKLSDLNQNGLRPFLEPLLAGKKLVALRLNGTASAQYEPNGDSAVKADLLLANLVVRDPKQDTPATPLEAKVQVDTALAKQVADVRQFLITLSPTDRARNQLELQGRVDLSQSNAITGNLKLVAESLDLTRYYDLFAGEKEKQAREREKVRGSAGTPPPEGAPSSPSNQEPAAKHLPFRNLVVEANIREFYLRELAVTNWLTTAKLDGSRVLLNPCQLTINGAPVKATVDLDVGVPGYKYDLSFNADKVPFAPLWNSFRPERKGQIGGTLMANAQLSGAGTTGVNLKRTLTGNFDIDATNLNLSVNNVRQPVVKAIIKVVAMLPELAKNPTSASVGTLLGALTGNRASRGGLMDELTKSPIDVMAARGQAASGRVELQQAVMRSSAFEATAQGTVTLADVLDNSSIRIPVAVSLNRSVAERVNLVPANTPTNAAYARLPDFLTLAGTLGDPKPDINYLALAGTVFRSYSGIVPGVVEGAGNAGGSLLQGLGGILDGRGGRTNAPNTATNAAPEANTNQTKNPVNDLFNPILGPKKE